MCPQTSVAPKNFGYVSNRLLDSNGTEMDVFEWEGWMPPRKI